MTLVHLQKDPQRSPFQSPWLGLSLLTLAGITPPALANVGDAFGFGSKSRSFSGATVSGGAEAFSAYHNPASIGAFSSARLQFSYGMVFVQPNFLPIKNVVIQNRHSGDQTEGNPLYGEIDMSYRPTFGQEIGLTYRLFADRSTLNLGLVSFIPIQQIAMFDTGERLQPEYVLYRARTQRPQVNLGVGSEILPGFHLGAGVGFDFSITSHGEAFITGNAGTSSSMKFSSSVKPKLTPYVGLLYAPQTGSQSVNWGAVVRLASATENIMTLKTRARVLGEAAVDLDFNGTSALYYDPLTLELGGSFPITSSSRLYTQLDWQMWNAYQPPALFLEEPTQNHNFFRIMPGKAPDQSYTNILIPKVGQEIRFTDTTALRLGYAYRPSFLSTPTTGAGNYLDPPKHVLNLGMGIQSPRFLGLEVPMSLDFHLTYHALVRQTIVKTAANESGNAQDPKIGSPGYDAGGNLWGAGMNLSLAL
ncbi:MAG: OmpP1/FadL family transporter [Bdellovibrionia bacterium]